MLASFFQRVEGLLLAHAAEIVRGVRCEPCLHIKVERRCKRGGMAEALALGSVALALNGVDRYGGAEGKEFKKRLLLLFKAP